MLEGTHVSGLGLQRLAVEFQHEEQEQPARDEQADHENQKQFEITLREASNAMNARPN
ncbi:hypothetical protein OG780_27365 [Streptomyces sp. NBC_00386]|jgi:hypothetical protein|uniref:hypothetical protein n=1 Tax=Streptomyces sp. NBC_00386 TaxID=2975734 RepID=UPI002E20D44B